MEQIKGIITAQEMQFVKIPYFVVSKICSTLEVWGIEKNGAIFPIIDKGFDGIKFNNLLEEWSTQGIIFGIKIRRKDA